MLRRLLAVKIFLLGFTCFVFGNRFGKLVGARGVALATDTRKQRLDIVDILTLDKTSDALQVAAATADKPNVVHFIVCVNVEKNLSGTSPSCGISKHFS